MLGLTFCFNLDWGSYIIAKTASKKIGALILSTRFLSPEVALYLNKSTIHPYMEYCCHVWCGAPSCYLELLDKLQKRIWMTVGPSLAASFEPLAHCWNLASLSLFFRYFFGRCFSELTQLVPLPFSWGRSTPYSDRLHDFSVTISRCYKDVYVNSFFPRTVRLWNSLPIEYFPMTYELSCWKECISPTCRRCKKKLSTLQLSYTGKSWTHPTSTFSWQQKQNRWNLGFTQLAYFLVTQKTKEWTDLQCWGISTCG